MPHARKRHIAPVILRKLGFTPIVAIQGARQTGKSFLVKELLRQSLPELEYVTLDQPSAQDFARSNPESFLSQWSEANPLAIDEAQKAPRLFDALKFVVDRDQKRGKFLILGSTEFSKLTLIRESLTGRQTRVRLFPMNLAETLGWAANPARSSSLLNESDARATRDQLIQYLARGGMPGMFSIRDSSEREQRMQDWLDLTARRDVMLFPKTKLDPELCFRILDKIALLEEPDAGSIARSLKRDLRRIKTHLNALAALFAVNVLEPHPLGSGKPLYFLCDVAFATYLGASFERQLQTWVLQEQLSQRSIRDDRTSKLYYYRTPKGSKIDLVIETRESRESKAERKTPNENLFALKIFSEERVLDRDVEVLRAFARKADKLPGQMKVTVGGLGAGRCSFAAGGSGRPRTGRIDIFPWESLA